MFVCVSVQGQPGPAVPLSAARASSHEPATPPTADYMALPASQYSVLDAETVERLDDDTFLCHVAGLTFFSFEVHPVLTVSVSVGPTGPTVDLLKTEVGSVAS